jgi:hypothetical protein
MVEVRGALATSLETVSLSLRPWLVVGSWQAAGGLTRLETGSRPWGGVPWSWTCRLVVAGPGPGGVLA